MREACCMDCRYLVWLVGVGQGIRCSAPANTGRILYPGVNPTPFNLQAPPVPSRSFGCEHFALKKGTVAERHLTAGQPLRPTDDR